MTAKDRMAVLSAMMEQGIIPVFYHPEAEVCVKVIQACADWQVRGYKQTAVTISFRVTAMQSYLAHRGFRTAASGRIPFSPPRSTRIRVVPVSRDPLP